jgi:acyl carrier protein
MSVDVGRRVRVTIARELACPLSRLSDGADFRRDLGADSLDLVGIPHALEDEFGVSLTDGEVEFCQTVGTAIDVIRSKLENGARFDRRAGVR